jgi:hypothetical protein
VKNIGRVYVFQSAQDLIDEGLEMCVGEGLSRSNDSSEIAFHEFYLDVRVWVKREGL